MKKGRYIVFEGPEGSGKGTQKKFLLEKLENVGISNIGVREPGGTPLGEEIYKIFKIKTNFKKTRKKRNVNINKS
jgi:dTMP kinase